MTSTSRPAAPVAHDTILDRMQYRADPLADKTIADILRSGTPMDTALPLALQWKNQWQTLAAVTRVFEQWPDNRSLVEWSDTGTGLTPDAAAHLAAYTRAGRALPDWADPAKIERAEALFSDYGALSVTLLFCSSLPECYVIPDLAAVLHVSGQLEKHTEYRIRSTGAMVFPVMMRGGLLEPDGGGIAQIFKVRLIHATIRHLILRGSPDDALAALGANQNVAGAGVVPPLPSVGAGGDMHQALFAHGWKTGEDGLPCNQEELAYTLLTFSFVFLRSMRRLGLALPPADEEAYMHAWNVAGHMLGIERSLMAESMTGAEKLFAAMQTRGRADWAARPAAFDPRPALGSALMEAMENAIPLRLFKSFPVLMTRHLCGPISSQDLGLTLRVSWFSRVLFKVIMLTTRVIDSVVRIVLPEFSLARLLTRILGYHLMTKLILDMTRPLKLPQHLLNRVDTMMALWSEDSKAPGWINSLEDRMTIQGSWKKAR